MVKRGVLKAGSSSQKSKLYELAEKLPMVSRREGIGHLPNTLFGGKTQVLDQLTAIDIVSTSCFFLD